jgi:hypothetical protein
MGVVYNYNAGAKTIAATTAQTISWSATDVSGDGSAAYYFAFTSGSNNDYGSLSRARIKASGSTIVDVAQAHLTAYIQRMSTSKWAMAGADTEFTVPLYTLDSKGPERYAAGFPNGQSPTLEVVLDGTGAAGTIEAGWRLYEGQFPFYSMLLGSQLNIAASATNGRFPITQPGLFRGFSVDITGLDRLRLVINGKQLINLSGSILEQSQAMEGQDGGTSGSPLFFKVDEMLPITAGNSFVEIDTGSGWGGTTNEITLLTYVPQEATNTNNG